MPDSTDKVSGEDRPDRNETPIVGVPITFREISTERRRASDVLDGTAQPEKGTIGTHEIVTYDLPEEEKPAFLDKLLTRLSSQAEHYKKPGDINFSEVKRILESNPEIIFSLFQMEKSGGAPDIIEVKDNEFVFADCSEVSPLGRRNLDYYHAVIQAHRFGVEIMSESDYHNLQQIGQFDWSSSSWVQTPENILQAGKAQYGLRFGDSAFNVSEIAATHSDEYRGWRGVKRVFRGVIISLDEDDK
jgi:hypothetical protein